MIRLAMAVLGVAGVLIPAFAADVSEPRYLDQILEDLQKRPRTSAAQSASANDARKLQRAWNLYSQGRPIGSFSADSVGPEWRDHALALQAFAAQAQAARLLNQNPNKSSADAAIQNAQRAAAIWMRVHEQFPDSPYERRHEEYLAESDLLVAQALSLKQRHALALEAFHRAFVRLSAVQLPLRMHRDRLAAFAYSCQKALNATCAHWTLKLARAFPDGSVEKKLFVEKMPYLSEIPTPEYGYRYNPLNYKTADQDQKAFDEAFAQVLTRKYSDAIEKMETLLRDFPRTQHRQRVQFWLGRLYGLQGQEEKFRSTLRDVLNDAPLTYYGLLAALSLGVTPDAAIEAQLPRAHRTDAFMTPSERMRFERVAQLGPSADGTPTWFAVDLKEFKARSTLSSPFLMYAAALASRSGRHLTAFQTIGDLIQRGYAGVTSSAVLRMIFPLPYVELIQSIAEEEKVDPTLVLSLTKQESAFDPDAISSSGALGLMQLMPFTAVEVDPNIEQRQILDPKANLKLGTRYLGQLIRKFNGNAVYALAGYNAGPFRVRAWRREANKDGSPESDMLEFVETIPFTETRGYVSSIMRNYFWYTYLQTGKALKSLTFFWVPPAAQSTDVPAAEPMGPPTPSATP